MNPAPATSAPPPTRPPTPARSPRPTLALQVAGLDPTVFPDGAGGTRNLPAELRLSMSADGQFGPNDFPLVHALAVLALHRTTGGVPAEAVSWLQGTQCTTPGDSFGAYGFSGCGDVDVDGTSLASQALLAAGVAAGDPSVADANGWLTGLQQPDGGLPSSFGSANTNGTGLAGQTFLALGEDAAAGGAAGYVGGLQVSCASLVDGSKLTVADVGAIAYDPTGFQDGDEFGIDTVSVDQWVRAARRASSVSDCRPSTRSPPPARIRTYRRPPTARRSPRRRPRRRRRPLPRSW